MLRALGLRSWIIVPLIARDTVLGVLTLVTAEADRIFQPADVTFATDLGQRIAVAVDNARLYEEAQIARAAAEALAADVTEQCRLAREEVLTVRAERDRLARELAKASAPAES